MTTAARPAESPAGVAGFRLLVGLIGAVAALAGASGVVAPILFEEPDTLKFAATVVAPLLVVAVCVVEDPLRLLAGFAVVIAPFGDFVATFGGVQISFLVLVLIAATTLALVEGAPSTGPSGVAIAGSAAALLIVVPLGSGAWPDHLVVLAGAGAMAFVVARVAARRGGARFLLGCLVLAGALQAAIALWEFRSGQQLNPYRESAADVFGRHYFFGFEDLDRPTAALFDPNSLGNVLALALPISVAIAACARTARGRFASGAAAAVIALGLLVTFSRMSWIAAGLGICVTIALIPAGARLRAMAAAMCVAVVAGAVAASDPEVATRFESISDPTSRVNETFAGDLERLAIWRGAGGAGQDHPISGVGLGNLPSALAERGTAAGPGSHAHSTYLQLFAEGGVLAVLALAVILGAVAWSIRAGLRRDRFLTAGLAGAFIAVLVVWITDYSVRYLAVAATMAVLAGVAAGHRPRQGTASDTSPRGPRETRGVARAPTEGAG